MSRVADSWASTPGTRASMQANRSRDTRPELLLRRALHGMGFRYSVCARPLPTTRRTTDLVFRRDRVAVEVRGCFWHGCADHYRPPSRNRDYWSAKVQRNIDRDRDTERRLDEAGWTLIVIWEHENMQVAAQEVATLLRRLRSGPGLD